MSAPSLPPAFVARMQAQLGTEWDAFCAALAVPAPVSVRLNPRKPASSPPGADAVPWHPQGRYLAERPVFTLDPLYHAGAYYVQEASSMLLQLAVRDLQPRRALDLSAAPGGKTTLLDAALPPECLLVAIEPVRSRASILLENLQRWGITRPLVITSGYADAFGKLAGTFDLVLVDAPCSGEGLWRKQPAAVAEWSAQAVADCAVRQREILWRAAQLVAPGGHLLYSTCTYAPAENAAQVLPLLSAEFEAEVLPVDPAWGWEPISEAGQLLGYQAYPHRVRGEGLFLARLRKHSHDGGHADRSSKSSRWKPVPIPPAAQEFVPPGNWVSLLHHGVHSLVPEPARAEVLRVLDGIEAPVLQAGIPLGEAKGRDWVPHHALALLPQMPALPQVPLDREQALRFLKREPFISDSSSPTRGWAVVSYQGLGLGWVKGVPGRWNNYLPKQWRIRMDLPDELP